MKKFLVCLIGLSCTHVCGSSLIKDYGNTPLDLESEPITAQSQEKCQSCPEEKPEQKNDHPDLNAAQNTIENSLKTLETNKQSLENPTEAGKVLQEKQTDLAGALEVPTENLGDVQKPIIPLAP